MKMIHKYSHLLADQVEYNGNLLKKGKIIKLIETNNNNKTSLETLAKVKYFTKKKSKIEKEFNIQISLGKDKNISAPCILSPSTLQSSCPPHSFTLTPIFFKASICFCLFPYRDGE